MILVPMEDTREGTLLHHLPQGHSSTYRTKSYILGGISDTQHGDSFPGYDAKVLHRLGGILLAMELGDHAEAGGTAFHGVGLFDVGEFHILTPYSLNNSTRLLSTFNLLFFLALCRPLVQL